MSQSPHAHLSIPDPEWAAEVAKIPDGQEIPTDVAGMRQTIVDVFIGTGKRYYEPMLPDALTYKVMNHIVHLPDGATTAARTITPISPETGKSYPCIVWVHGGGGNVDFDDYRMRIIAMKYQLVAVLLDYRLAPEHPFPIPHRDAYEGLKWVAKDGHTFGADLAQGFILGGTSAGGNIAATLAHKAQSDPFFEGKRLTGHILTMPSLIHPHGYPERYSTELQSINIPDGAKWTCLPKEYAVDMFVEGLQSPPTDPEGSPLLYPKRHILPPTYLQIAGLDPLRDEGILYERLLREAGVKTRISIYPGVPHGFHLAWPHMTASQKCEEDLKAGVKWLLELHRS
ncbi:Alpha/Beta hydrolase protein [Cristinia sonorae]|uniref:Alpha/Beta hydrolase protein n=1 Tax=Cristinia sonorae TaxID=1940300 RepID=A0A8K0UME9_9AGAR|nr:Alpha/Beta hydrolase protein [Cristinia sonorae]